MSQSYSDFVTQDDFGGAWTRTRQDIGSYTKELNESTYTIERQLDPAFAERCNPCFPDEVGYISKQGVSYDTNRPLVDSESDLRNLDRLNSRDPFKKYIPNCPDCCDCSEGYPCGGGVTSGCNTCQKKLYNFPECSIRRDYTRLSNPTCTMRETGVNRFQPLYLNHQDPRLWEAQAEVGINYRMIVKDNHVPCIPNLIDQTAVLPDACNPLPCYPTVPVCYTPMEAMHPHYNY